ncbi:hypothetical protein I4U23_015628 [Adineta vaga]|nr:hypothetical protein I4U23_015628 [Adineta vaga]
MSARKSSDSNQQVDVESMSQKQKQQADDYANDEIQQADQKPTTNQKQQQDHHQKQEVNVDVLSQKQRQQADEYASEQN